MITTVGRPPLSPGHTPQQGQAGGGAVEEPRRLTVSLFPTWPLLRAPVKGGVRLHICVVLCPPLGVPR